MPPSPSTVKAFFILILFFTASCTSAKNIAAKFIPTGHQNFAFEDLKSGAYRLDPEHTSVRFSFDHMGFSTTRVRIDRVSATLDFDQDSPGSSKLAVTLDMASVNTNVPKFDEVLTSSDFFDVEKFPEATFHTSAVYFTSDTTAEMPGTLTLHGVSREVVFYVTFRGGARNWISGKYTLGFSAFADVNRSDFGLKNLLALTGDAVKIEIDSEFNLMED